jgi:hypothetical protein
VMPGPAVDVRLGVGVLVRVEVGADVYSLSI